VWRRFQRLQDDILGILKHAALKTLIDERFNFGLGDLDGHKRAPSLFIIALQ
jgi:hypothetical protein